MYYNLLKIGPPSKISPAPFLNKLLLFSLKSMPTHLCHSTYSYPRSNEETRRSRGGNNKWKQTPFAVNGVSLSEPYTSVVYGNMCIDRPTDRVRSSLIPSPSPQLSSLAVRITQRSFSASDDSCGEGLGTRLCSSHSHDANMLQVPMLPCSCAWWQCVVVKTENANDGKAKSRDTHATNCEAGMRETSEPLHTCASLLVSPSLAFTYVTFSCRSLHTKPFSHFST